MVAVDEPDEANEKSCPVPLSDTFCGLPTPLSWMSRIPVLAPEAVGSKKTPMVQFMPGSTGFAQLLSVPKSATLDVTALMVSTSLPVLVTVRVWGRPEVPTYWFTNVILDGDRPILAPTPVPVKLTLCGPPATLSETMSEATAPPTPVGVNVRLMVQLLFT